MNQNDFYKELMTKYAFDSDKIKAKAIKQAKRPFVERIFTEHKAVTACACAALMLTAGVYGFVSLNGLASPLDILSSNDVLTASQRLEEAEKNYALLYDSSDDEGEIVGMYISFTEPISYSEALMTFSSVSDTGDVQPAIVYLSDGTRIEKPDISAFAMSRNGEKTVTGMKIIAPFAYYKEIQDLNIVSLVETAFDKLSDDTFVPIIGTGDPLSTTPTQATTAEPDSVPENDITIGKSEETVAIQTDVVTGSTTTEPVITTTTTTEAETTTDSSEAVSTDRPETSVTETETETTTEAPVITEPDSYTIELNGVISAAVINETDTLVLADSGAYIYRINDKYETELATSISLVSPKMEWSSGIVKHVLISGCNTDGLRSVIVDYNIETSEFNIYDLSGIMTDNELGGVYYSYERGCIFVKAVGTTTTNIYYIETVGGKAFASPIVTSKLPVTPLCFSNGVFTYAISEADRTVVYSLKKGDTAATVVAAYECDVVFTRSNYFDCYAAAYTNADNICVTMIVDRSGASHCFNADGSVIFGNGGNNTLFTDRSGFYSIVNGSIVAKTFEDVAERFESGIDISPYTLAEVSFDRIVIVKE